jgi:hypothetical protein
VIIEQPLEGTMEVVDVTEHGQVNGVIDCTIQVLDAQRQQALR